jgi:hypothetical protein
MTQIIGFCGRAQSGKTSGCNFLAGYFLRQKEIIQFFDMDESGNLLIPVVDEQGKQNLGVLDFNNKNPEFFDFASENIWPTVKLYNIADQLKMACHKIFGVSIDNLYGTNEEKNAPTHIPAANIFPLLNVAEKKQLKLDLGDNEYLSARQLMQYFGTNICRKIDNDCWVKSCLNQIKLDNPEVALIADIRFENELDAIVKTGEPQLDDSLMMTIQEKPFIFKLARNPLDSNHQSEVSVDEIPLEKFNAIIPADLDIFAKNTEIQKQLLAAGIIQRVMG